MMKKCAFTGQRPKSFPWKYDETARDCISQKKVFAAQIAALVEQGITDFCRAWLLAWTSGAPRLSLASKRNPEVLHASCIARARSANDPPRHKNFTISF